MTLRNFKDSPERYQGMKSLFATKGIEINDDTDINDILEQKTEAEKKKAENRAIDSIVAGGNKRRMI